MAEANALTKLFGSSNPAGSAINAAATVANTISNIVGANKQQQYLMSLNALDERDQVALARELNNASSNNQKIQILSASLTKYLTDNDNQANKNQTVLYIIAAVLVTVLLVIIFLSNKNKPL